MTEYNFTTKDEPTYIEFLRAVADCDKSTELHGKFFSRSKTLAWLHHFAKMNYLDIETEKGKPLKISLTEKGEDAIKE